MDKNNLFIIDDEAMLENFEDKSPKNAFEFLKITKGIDIEYKFDNNYLF